MQKIAQLNTEIAELRAKYEELMVQCERLMDENEQLRAHKEHLTEEMNRIAVLCEQGLCIQEIFSDTPVAINETSR
jgi:regulator of replication initiation timing